MVATPQNEFVLIGAGLPRTGTLSTRAALQKLLPGNIYHMVTVASERPDHHPFWRRAGRGVASIEDWHRILEGYSGGVDYPISFFYKDLMKAFPNAKVLLNVRDPVKWYESVHNSIYKKMMSMTSFPVTWFNWLLGMKANIDTRVMISDLVPASSSNAQGMFSAVAAGQEAAVQFYQDHVNEVKRVVPADRLLVWEVKEGWGPLCKFLDVPVPDLPFPRVNDTAEINKSQRTMTVMSWIFVVLVPSALAATAWTQNFSTPTPFALMVAGYGGAIALLRRVMTNTKRNPAKKGKIE